MMFFKNDVFTLNGVRYRFLEVEASAYVDSVWVIATDDKNAMPIQMSVAAMHQGQLEQIHESAIGVAPSKHLHKCEKAWEQLRGLLEIAGSRLFDPERRSIEIRAHAAEIGCSKTTLYKHLRRYWQRGQTKFALLPDYQNCGTAKSIKEDGSLTAGRGRSTLQGQRPFQMCCSDAEQMKAIIESAYLKDRRVTMVDAYKQLIRKNYRFEDGNGALQLMPVGDRPSFRQFQTYLKAHYNLEVILRSRKGDAEYAQQDRKVTGTTLQDCLGVGHYYEIDATIVDIYVVSSEDRRKIIGKPTLYLIIDRKSRLLVGFYLGLEHASWTGAMQAILSISEDKSNLCAYYGVEYKPADWPAHQVFPQEFLADRGSEMLSYSSSQIADDLAVTVTNLPGKRPDWKPLVECRFRLLHESIRTTVKAYDPPENAKKRQGKNYSKDACHTLQELGAILLNAIISHNRREILDYPLSNKELIEQVRPSPIELWNHGVVTRAGLLSRYHEDTVRYALLPRTIGVVSEHGIELNGCYYTCAIAIERKWFEAARHKRLKLKVSYDKRLVDTAYVHYQEHGKDAISVATLTPRSAQFKGHSVGEVECYMHLMRQIRVGSVEQRLATDIALMDINAPTVEKSVAALAAAGPTGSRRSRRKDTSQERAKELAKERQECAGIPAPEVSYGQSNVIPFQGSKENGSAQPTEIQLTPMQARLAAAREKMKPLEG